MRLSDSVLVDQTRKRLKSGKAVKLREAAGVPAADAAKRLGVTEDSLFYWESGRLAPPAASALAYGKFLQDLVPKRAVPVIPPARPSLADDRPARVVEAIWARWRRDLVNWDLEGSANSAAARRLAKEAVAECLAAYG
jgi:DNA-binding XRE family transcriptional regulator